MKVLYALCFAMVVCIKADNFNGFLENIYDELHELNLTKEQEKALRLTIREHHKFLRQWYIDVKNNSDEVIKNFANSTLERHSIELMQDERLSEQRVKMEHDFIINVYNILNEDQRKKFGENINQQNHDNISSNSNTTFEFKRQSVAY